jgi:hypothetical protein
MTLFSPIAVYFFGCITINDKMKKKEMVVWSDTDIDLCAAVLVAWAG